MTTEQTEIEAEAPDCEDELDMEALYLRLIDALNAQGAAHRQLEDVILEYRRGKCSWMVIARALGVSRQAAWERWRHVDARLDEDPTPTPEFVTTVVETTAPVATP